MPAPLLVIPPVRVAFQFVTFELIAVIAPELRILTFPVVNSLRVIGCEAPFVNVILPVVALFARVHGVALAEIELLPFPAPNVRVLADEPEPFVNEVAFVELNPSLNVIEVAKMSAPVIVIPVAATLELLPAPAKMKW